MPRDWFDWLLIVAMLFVVFWDGIAPSGPTEICAVTVSESLPNPPLTTAQVEAVGSREAAEYMESNGYPFQMHQDPDQANPPAWIKAAITEADGTPLPVLVIFSKDGRLLHVGHIDGPDDVLPVLEQYGGEQ